MDAPEVKAWTDRLGEKSRPEGVALIFFSSSFINYMNRMPKSPEGFVSIFHLCLTSLLLLTPVL